MNAQDHAFAEFKSRQAAVWASGDFALIGTTLQIVGEELAEAVDVRAGQRVLDIAAGNGNASLAAARRYADVTSTDLIDALLARGERRAQAEGLNIRFRQADAEDLPFPDHGFDVVLSTFGAMPALDPQRAAREMVRMVKPGGRIGLANWTADGFIADLLHTIAAYRKPPPGLRSPVLWGTTAYLKELFGNHALAIRTRRKTFCFRYRSNQHWLQVFRHYYGPVRQAFADLPAAEQRLLERDILKLLARQNIGGPRGLVVPSHYLEAVIDIRL